MGKRFWIWSAALLLAAAAAAAVAGYVQFKGDAVTQECELFISRRADYASLVDSLKPRIRHHAAFDWYARRLALDTTFKPGHYEVRPGMDVIELVRMFKLGLQTPVQVAINNVRTPEQLAGKLARQIDADSTELLRTLTSPEVVRKAGFETPETLFSIFLPNTYELYWTVTPDQFVERMQREYERFWTPERDALRARSGLSRLEVMTLASIVSEETRQSDEMARIAGVYINRLRRGIPLQADPTIKYAMKDFGLRRILYRHLKYPSPYNTYLNQGLPPSPICMPAMAAIEAVLHFEEHDYIFFCARPTFDGHHNFARTLAEHNANARAWAAELNRRNIK